MSSEDVITQYKSRIASLCFERDVVQHACIHRFSNETSMSAMHLIWDTSDRAIANIRGSCKVHGARVLSNTCVDARRRL